MTRLGGIVLDVAPQADDEIIDCAGIGVLPQIPHIFQNRFARNRPSILPYQMTQQLRFHQCELHGVSPGAQLESIKVQSLAVKREEILLCCLCGILARARCFLARRLLLRILLSTAHPSRAAEKSLKTRQKYG